LLFENTARAMGDAKLHIKERYVGNCAKADPAYGKGVADALAKFADANSNTTGAASSLSPSSQTK
jgi:catalase